MPEQASPDFDFGDDSPYRGRAGESTEELEEELVEEEYGSGGSDTGMLGEEEDGGEDHDDDDHGDAWERRVSEHRQALRQWMFDELGITVNSKKRKNKKQDDVTCIGQKNESFIGAECVKLIAKYDKALEHNVRETYPTVSASDDVKAQIAWEI
eukprot:jgi/Tetstr1/446717/TSEL_034205.t1